MESVQQRSGLSAFRVVMDDSHNTPEVVDRNPIDWSNLHTSPQELLSLLYLTLLSCQQVSHSPE